MIAAASGFTGDAASPQQFAAASHCSSCQLTGLPLLFQMIQPLGVHPEAIGGDWHYWIAQGYIL